MSRGKRQLRAAVIGCGFIGCGKPLHSEAVGVLSHADAYLTSDSTELVALCDASQQRLDEVAADYPGVATCTSVAECLDKHRPELVSIATPDATHYEVALEVCEAGSVAGILLEKPIALTAAQARKVVQAAATNNVTLAVNYTRRYTKRFQLLAKQIRSGELGDLQKILGVYTKGILHNGSHWIDILDMFGVQVTSVLGELHGASLADQSDPTPDVRFECTHGSALLAGCNEKHFTVFEMDVLGATGRVRLSDGGHTVESFRATPSELYAGYTTLSPAPPQDDGGMRDAITHAVEDLAECVSKGSAPLSSGESAIRPILISEAVIESLRTGLPQEVVT